jgi:hypothetical protein
MSHNMSDRKSGHFWELEDWMAENDVSGRELAVLTGLGKNVISRLITGQFVRLDARVQRRINNATVNTSRPLTDQHWQDFMQRRLDERADAA